MRLIETVDIQEYNSGIEYEKYDVVSFDADGETHYLVSTQDGNENNLTTGNYENNSIWKLFGATNWSFDEIWTPTYNTSINYTAQRNRLRFGDGYSQIFSKGLITNRLRYNLTFNAIPEKEIKSLVAFFEYIKSDLIFLYKISDIFKSREFVCENWKQTYAGFERHNFNASIKEK